jgi:hypothetical protein
MNLCIRTVKSAQKFMGLSLADMARLPHLIKKAVFSSSPLAGTTHTLNLNALKGKWSVFISTFYL